MTLIPGTKLGGFEITALLGKGGMGEVYRARDTKLGRDVAVKVLSAQFCDNADMLARFEREALSLARLDHPNVAAIYEVGHSTLEPQQRSLTPEEILYGIRRVPPAAGSVSVHFLVMQLVEGETLSDRLLRGSLMVDEAIHIFGQIAEGLEAAHEAGIVHRDLKPANLKIAPDGRVKILDFGIAKTTEGRPAPGAPTPTPSKTVDPHAPTRPMSTPSSPLTGEEMLIGTPQYMSPEQIRGKTIDRRTDIWAFGVCLYQALTGKLPFDGEVVAEVFSSILRDEVDLDRLPPVRSLRYIVRRCLEREQRYRLRDIGEAWVLLNRPDELLTSVDSDRGARPQARFHIPFPKNARLTTGLAPLAISRRGDRIAAALVRDDSRQLYLRRLESMEFNAVPGTERGRIPRFSPSGESILFVQGNTIKIVGIAGGAGRTLVECGAAPISLLCAQEDLIYWSTVDSGLCKTDLATGRTERISQLDREAGEQWHIATDITEDGQWLLVAVTRNDKAQLQLLSAIPPYRRATLSEGYIGKFIGSDIAIVSRREELFAGCVGGNPPTFAHEPVCVVTDVRTADEAGAVAVYDVSAEGSLVYAHASSGFAPNSLYWVSMTGERREIAKSNRYQGPRISPDGDLVSLGCLDAKGVVVMHTYDLERGVLEKMTAGTNVEAVPVWHPDGVRVAIAVQRGGGLQLHEYNMNTCVLRPTGEPGKTEWPSSYSTDGKYLACVHSITAVHSEICVRDEAGKVEKVVDSQALNVCPRFDPVGSNIAYASNETGSWQVFIVPFKSAGRRIQVSVDGGVDPVWAPDGSRLYFRRGDTLMAATVTREPRLRVGVPSRLFEFPFGGSVSIWTPSFDIHPDGTRFIMADTVAGRVGATELMVVMNWREELQTLLQRR